MGGRASKRKGAAAEREVAKLIQGMLSVVGDFELKRNLLQTREGGFDLDGLPGVAIEVKRVEALSIGTWWRQTKEQATEQQTLAILPVSPTPSHGLRASVLGLGLAPSFNFLWSIYDLRSQDRN